MLTSVSDITVSRGQGRGLVSRGRGLVSRGCGRGRGRGCGASDVFYMDPAPGTSSGTATGYNLPPRQHNRYGSGDLSGQLVDDFSLPICRVVTRSMFIRSSQASDF